MFQKKSKTDAISSEVNASIKRTADAATLDTISVSDDDDEPSLPKNSDKALDPSDDNKAKENGDEQTEERSSVGLTKSRLLPGKRGRAIERRKASTKRWVERKKALLAATGEDVSDTDSIVSDEAQMSPVQKARAKTNADKEAERQKRVAKVLKNLETNLTEKYTAIRDGEHFAVGDTDSDTRKTRLSKELHSSAAQDDKNRSDVRRTRSSSQEHPMEKENTPVLPAANNAVESRAKKSAGPRIVDDKLFAPSTVKSELTFGKDRYVVTSILCRSATTRTGKEGSNNFTKDNKNPNADDSGYEKNTDILESVKLRRVYPASLNSKKFERCLNVEVEAMGLEPLKRAQLELSEFVENELKLMLLDTIDGTAARVRWMENYHGTDYRKLALDDHVKEIVRKTITSNIEASFTKGRTLPKAHGQPSTTIPLDLVEMVKNSSAYQPIVVVERLDVEKASKLHKISNAYLLKQTSTRRRPIGPFSAVSRKRQSVPPKKYNDYNTSALDSDSDEADRTTDRQETPEVTSAAAPSLKAPDNAAAKQSPRTNNQAPIIGKQQRMDDLIVKAVNNSVTMSVYTVEQSPAATPAANEEKPDYEEAIKIEGAIAENHICGVCGLSFDSRKGVEAHVRNHKTSNGENNTITVTRQVQKPKVKRCKRCQMLVDARFVKAHVCKTPLLHKCYVCNSTFRTQKLLVHHLDSHEQSEFQIENIAKVEDNRGATADKSDKEPKTGALAKSQAVTAEKNGVQSDDKATRTGAKLPGDDTSAEKCKETYTCFVCDKIFTDEEVLKDHLQMHCDDLSEGEQSNSKEQFQCAICGDTLETDQALEEHVGKHLFDDEDDNPNLISIEEQESGVNDQSKIHQCDQCSEVFDSQVMLEMHVQEHEEENAIAEWEKKGVDTYPYECMLCGDCIETEEQLTAHLANMHNIHNADAQICQLCDQPFNTLEELQEHVATH